ncbi:hypothetical protein Pen02_61180 [Plantactinospora endophytica]|uniref:Uncharacterized protein n=1 Tax=Plantactinospora endophytica TaxID=673535 RepID=A0ABQ4E8W0_9ACTN|nr:hypothetical protein Pen02_61180 [Plantactinospora endophytica]
MGHAVLHDYARWRRGRRGAGRYRCRDQGQSDRVRPENLHGTCCWHGVAPLDQSSWAGAGAVLPGGPDRLSRPSDRALSASDDAAHSGVVGMVGAGRAENGLDYGGKEIADGGDIDGSS